ncbi:biotin synthase BioB [Scytonema sp. PRP1]|uniref:biotin synthase BioB n=1 Tax=Scytonema sp. PRP1 TaxID=3120513 RepID=UPI002FD77BD2
MKQKLIETLLDISEQEKERLLAAIQIDTITESPERENESRESQEYRQFFQSIFQEILHFEDKEQQILFDIANSVRQKHFGNKGILRGVIEITNACERSCNYCPMRIENEELGERYNFTSEKILETAIEIKESKIPIVFIQAGEIRATTRTVSKAISQIKQLFDNNVIILVNLGDKPKEDYTTLKEAGANQYIIKFETSNWNLHKQARGYSLCDRLARIDDLLSLGYEVGSGTIVGLKAVNADGKIEIEQTPRMLANDLLLAMKKKIHMCSASPFIPGKGTPLAQMSPGNASMTLNWMALARIMMPKVLIPSVSAFNVLLGQDGQLKGLQAGANTITVNYTPPNYQDQYAIYSKQKRYKVKYEYALDIMEKAGLEPTLLPNVPSQSFLFSQK